MWSYRNNKFLKPTVLKNGYCQVELSANGVSKKYYVHKLVAEAYISNPLGLPQINHKDENKQNNCVSNLEWCDAKYNNNYGNHNKAISKRVYCIELDKIFDSARGAARELNINSNHISCVCRGDRKTCGGLHWRYID